MRIVQLSDTHLSSSNLENLKNFYLKALLDDLEKFHVESKIDIILVTGDLIDQGGKSLGIDPYRVFEEEFINPIMTKLELKKENFAFIPGNHDIDRSKIEKYSEYFLINELNSDKANEQIKDLKSSFGESCARIERFKLFEKQFHSNSKNYYYSNAESVTIIEEDGIRLGIALINDSWRCSGELPEVAHFIGYNQLFNSQKVFEDAKTSVNIAAFHHPIDSLNLDEAEEIENILKSKPFSIALFGHSHKYDYRQTVSANGGYISIRGRGGLNEIKEESYKYQSGYNILDVEPTSLTYTIKARKYIKSSYTFDKDTDSLRDGEVSGQLHPQAYYELSQDSNNRDTKLPNGYTADVNRIVRLLIGKSIYPNPYIFTRELVQNSVDACLRVKEKRTYLNPAIRVELNDNENFVEVSDQGDGMSKFILKNHFSVVGRSISQEFNENSGDFNLISQFGIGFISTFIVAQKVVVTTKRSDSELIRFEVSDVFRGFEYGGEYHTDFLNESGTSVRVYLKSGFSSNDSFQNIVRYCRHIENIHVFYNGNQIKLNDSWNTDGVKYLYEVSSNNYVVKLGIGTQSRRLIASNSGFLINDYNPSIVPFRFPSIIGGEINFRVKAIDFDVSRSNILSTEKASSVRKEISVSVRKLFRDALESGDQTLIESVLPYFNYFLEYFDENKANVDYSYVDFFSKNEIIQILCDHTEILHMGVYRSLGTVIELLKPTSNNRIYLLPNSKLETFHTVVLNYLRNSGNCVIPTRSFSVNFHDSTPTVNLSNVARIIAEFYRFEVVDLFEVASNILESLTMDSSMLGEGLSSILRTINTRYNLDVSIYDLSAEVDPVIRIGNKYFVNYNHLAFQSLLQKFTSMDKELAEGYLYGLLGIGI